MNNLKPSQIIVMASGAVTFLFSFFAFYSASSGVSAAERREAAEFGIDLPGDISINAWDTDFFGPLSSWPALLGLIVAGLVAAVAFGNVSLPERVLTMSWPQLVFAAAFASALIMVGFLIMGTPGAGASFGFGFWLMLLGSIGLVVGSVMDLLEGDGAPAGPPSNQPPTSF